MELLQSTGLNFQLLVDYTMFGIILNFVSVIVSIIVSIIVSMKLSPYEMMGLIKFGEVRKYYVETHNSPFKRILSRLLFFLPMYTTYITIIFLYYVLKHQNLWGFIQGSIHAENFSIIRLVKYDMIDK